MRKVFFHFRPLPSHSPPSTPPSTASLHHQSTINTQHVPGDEARVVGGKEDHCTGHVFRRSQAAERRGVDGPLQVVAFGQDAFGQGSWHKAWRHDVDGDVAAAQFLGKVC